MRHRLEIKNLRLPARLGVGDAERAVEQWIELDVTLRFDSEPRGCVTDSIEDAFCYDVVCQALRRVTASRPFKLIESLAREAYLALKELPSARGAGIEVRVHKLNPPVDSLRGGAVFSYGDA